MALIKWELAFASSSRTILRDCLLIVVLLGGFGGKSREKLTFPLKSVYYSMTPKFDKKDLYLMPKELLLRKDLNPFERQVWTLMFNEADENGFSWGNKELAAALKTSAAYISQVVGDMREKDYIEDIKFDGRKRWVAPTYPELKDKKNISY